MASLYLVCSCEAWSLHAVMRSTFLVLKICAKTGYRNRYMVFLTRVHGVAHQGPVVLSRPKLVPLESGSCWCISQSYMRSTAALYFSCTPCPQCALSLAFWVLFAGRMWRTDYCLCDTLPVLVLVQRCRAGVYFIIWLIQRLWW